MIDPKTIKRYDKVWAVHGDEVKKFEIEDADLLVYLEDKCRSVASTKISINFAKSKEGSSQLYYTELEALLVLKPRLVSKILEAEDKFHAINKRLSELMAEETEVL